jgi:hypothetical protein
MTPLRQNDSRKIAQLAMIGAMLTLASSLPLGKQASASSTGKVFQAVGVALQPTIREI